MLSSVISEVVYIITSDQLPDEFFQGYCFIGNDYVIGHEGLKEYREKTNGGLTEAEDGCYVYAKKINQDTLVFENDFYGYKKIFYYWENGDWAVSNSILAIVEWMKSKGIEVIANYHQLSAIRKNVRSQGSQLFSFSTYIQGVKLMPFGFSLHISNHECRLLYRKTSALSSSYSELLIDYLNIWVSRFATIIMNDNIKFVCDLSGGVDSRAVFAIMNYAQSFCNKDIDKRLRLNNFTIAGRDSKDIEIAGVISSKYGYKLNSTSVYNSKLSLDGYLSYQAWKYLDLGCYHPIYFTKNINDPKTMAFTGGGGGNYKKVYTSKTFEGFYADFSKKQSVREAYKKFIESDFISSMGLIKLYNSGDELVLHYQYFRNMFHNGRAPQVRNVFNPLGSKNMAFLAAKASQRDIANTKLHFDIIGSLEFGLLEIPFDSDKKAPTPETLARLNLVPADKICISPGSVYGAFDLPERKVDVKSKGTAISYLYNDFCIAAKHEAVINFWGQKFLDSNHEVLQRALKTGKLYHATEGNSIAAVLCSYICFS